MMRRIRVVCLVIVIGGGGLLGGARDAATAEGPMDFELRSDAFAHGETIPLTHTCDGEDRSPALAWTAPPAGTKSLALVVDDPDAPMGRWVHWVVYHLPPSVRRLPEAFPRDAELPDGTRQGRTDFGRTGYGGPCPPSGTHHYRFILYALDVSPPLAPGAALRELEQAMRGHILAQATLVGTYRRTGR